jgi:hypothetical protein
MCPEDVKTITSLDDWNEFALDHESLDGYDVLPQAVAEFQHTHEITSNISLLPEAIEAWSYIKNSKTDAAEYNSEVLRIHGLLRSSSKDYWSKTDLLANIKNFFIKQNYEQLNRLERSITVTENTVDCVRKWAIGLYGSFVILTFVFIIEFSSLIS